MRRLRIALVALAAVAAWSTSVPFSGAHEGRGTMEVLAAEPAGPLEFAYRVRLVAVGDGHAVDGATVTAVAVDATGARTTPVPMASGGEQGVYAATVRFPGPGTWTVRFTAVSPAATAERSEVVAPPPTTTTTTTTTTVAPTTITAPDDAEAGGGSMPVLLGLALGLLGVAVASEALRRRRRGRAAPDGPGPDGRT